MKKVDWNLKEEINQKEKNKSDIKQELIGFRPIMSKEQEKISTIKSFEKFVENAKKNKKNLFNNLIKKDLNKWYGNNEQNSLFMKMYFYKKEIEIKEIFESSTDFKKIKKIENKRVFKNLKSQKNSEIIKDLKNEEKKEEKGFDEKINNFEDLFLIKIKRINFFWKGINTSFPFVFKKFYKKDDNEHFEYIDFACKKTKFF